MTIASEVKEYQNLINGEFVPASTGNMIDSIDPSTGEVWAKIPKSTKEDIELTVTAARNAFPAWSALTVDERANYMRRIADIIAANAEELSVLESRDNGWAIREVSYGLMPVLQQYWNDAAGAASIASRGETIQMGPTSFGYTLREPLGVILGITPWNSPLFTFTIKAAYALAAGNTVIIKPSAQASVSSLRLAELIGEVLPPGVLNVISGSGSELGDDLVGHKGIDKVSLTGSGGTAESIVKATAKDPVPLTLELGGKSPNIVFEDANLEKAIEGLTSLGIFNGNAGEICAAGSRILVQRPIFEKMVSMMKDKLASIKLGSPMDPLTEMGPVANAAQYKKIRSYIDIGVEEGEVIYGGRHGAEALLPNEPELADGYWIEPTLLKVNDNSLRVCQEEIFGPVAVIMPFDTEEEALEIANDTDYGLAAGVWTTNLDRAQRMVRSIHAGNVWVNTYGRVGIDLPFGGVKASGYGTDSILENTREKACVIES